MTDENRDMMGEAEQMGTSGMGSKHLRTVPLAPRNHPGDLSGGADFWGCTWGNL